MYLLKIGDKTKSCVNNLSIFDKKMGKKNWGEQKRKVVVTSLKKISGENKCRVCLCRSFGETVFSGPTSVKASASWANE